MAELTLKQTLTLTLNVKFAKAGVTGTARAGHVWRQFLFVLDVMALYKLLEQFI